MLFLSASKLSAQGPALDSNFNNPERATRIDVVAGFNENACLDNEIVVALQGQGPGMLRALNYRNGNWVQRTIAELPVSAESIDIGSIKPGKNSIVAGLSQPYPGSAGSVRVFTYNRVAGVWDQEALGPDIQGNVEAIAIGDVDRDGQAEVIAGIEGGQYETRVRAYRYNTNLQSWSYEPISALSYQQEVQYVDVVDLYGTGQPVVLILTSNWNFSPARSELRAFMKIGGVWNSELLAANIGGYTRAERFAAVNLDSDRELEIVVGMHGGYIGGPGALYMVDFNGTSWVPGLMNGNLGVLDGLGTGNLSGNATPDLIVGTDRNVLLYSRIGGVWAPSVLQQPINATISWDADIGTIGGLGTIGIAALDNRLMMYRKVAGAYSAASTVNFPRLIDSAQIGDVDQLSFPCRSKNTEFLSDRLNVLYDR